MAEAPTLERLPRRLGRFEIAGVLAKPRAVTGSTILVGRAGTSGSRPPPSPDGAGLSLSYSPARPNEATSTMELPVAIKMLASSMAADPKIGEPFLAGARAVVDLRHPNLSHVLEVGHDGSHMYLVMNLLKGETVATLLRALQGRGETLDFTLAAHIVSEAAAGLEAAHEKKIIHGQLTPHDVFVGYDGSVRVLDVGIAAARSKAIGDLGGRGRLVVQYASPERCKKQPLDKQADVFSLGAILWELCTSISPFERAKEADTIKAICDEPMVPPGTAFRGLPEQLSMITMQALEREKTRRYPTAGALHDALKGFVRLLGMTSSPKNDLSAVMKDIFEKRAADSEAMTARLLAGKPIDDLDILEPDDDADPASFAPRLSRPSVKPREPKDVEYREPSVVVEPTISSISSVSGVSGAEGSRAPDATPAALGADTVPDVPLQAPIAGGSRKRFVTALIAGNLAIGLGVVIVMMIMREEPRHTKTTPSATPSSVAAQLATPSSSAAPSLPSASPSASAATSAAPVESSSTTPEPVASEEPAAPDVGAAQAEETVLHIETIPAHVAIYVGGTKKGTSPMDLKVPKGKDTVVVELRQPGYQTLKERVVPDMNQKLKLTLAPVRGGPPATTGTGSAPYHKFQ